MQCPFLRLGERHNKSEIVKASDMRSLVKRKTCTVQILNVTLWNPHVPLWNSKVPLSNSTLSIVQQKGFIVKCIGIKGAITISVEMEEEDH